MVNYSVFCRFEDDTGTIDDEHIIVFPFGFVDFVTNLSFRTNLFFGDGWVDAWMAGRSAVFLTKVTLCLIFLHSLDLEIDCVCLLTSSCEKKEKF